MHGNIPFRERVSCTIPEACNATGLGRSKLYEEIQLKRVRTVKIGKRTLVVVASLVSLIEDDGAKQAEAVR
jgi:hypothetical protein